MSFTAQLKPLGDIIQSNTDQLVTLTGKVGTEKAVFCRVQVAQSGARDLNRVATYRVDGTDTTASTGMILGDTDIIEFTAGELEAGVTLIGVDSADGTAIDVSIQYYANNR